MDTLIGFFFNIIAIIIIVLIAYGAGYFIRSVFNLLNTFFTFLRHGKFNPPLKPKNLRNNIMDESGYISHLELRRRYSAGFRTGNKKLRVQALDEEQLIRYGLPVWKSEADIAKALGISLKELQYFSIHKKKDNISHYYRFEIEKRSGGNRTIYAPKKKLKELLRKLDSLLVSKLPVSEYAHGFRKNYSIKTNVSTHSRKKVIIKFDLKDCFETLHYGRVRGLLIALGYSYYVAAALAVLLTEASRRRVSRSGEEFYIAHGPRYCVQGAPTSPGLCNALLIKLDRRLAGLAKSLGFEYTRYADDLTFSSDDDSKIPNILAMVSKIVKDEGFVINTNKTNIMRPSQRQVVTGIVVNDMPSVPRDERKKIRAALHVASLNPENVTTEFMQKIHGKIAFMKMVNPNQARPFQKKLKALEKDLINLN